MTCRIWIDLETTHLDPARGHILELAVVATEAEAPEYREVASQAWVIKHPYRPGIDWDDILSEQLFQMHGQSGLLDDSDGGVSLAEAEAGLLNFLRYFGNPAPGREPIAGSSPHFDRGWLQHHLPTAARYFNHRVFCASALKRFVLDHGVEWPVSDGEGSGGGAHRALADVRHSIETARICSRLLSALHRD